MSVSTKESAGIPRSSTAVLDGRPAACEPQAEEQKSGGRRVYASTALWGLAMFAVVCQLMAATKLGSLHPEDFPYPTWTSWAIKEYNSPKTPTPNLVFLGSSLMLVPLDGVDADFTKKPIDGAKHHKSIFFESKFKDYSGDSIRTFNLALPGEMPSDAYLLTKFLLKNEKRPDVIVYGVGPRDFMDNLLPSPKATDPFRYLSRLGDYNERIDLIAPKWEERLAYELARAIYPLGESENIMTSISRQFNNFLVATFPNVTPSSTDKRRGLLPEYHPFEINLKECYFRPTDEKNRPPFVDNIDEYRKRYKTLKQDTFESQMQFLTDILDTANARGTHVVLLAMPITDINRQLISDKAWEQYKTSLEKLAAAKGATYFDFYATKQFPLSDFGDTVHLHSGGGARLLDMLAKKLADNHEIISSFNINRHDDTEPQVASLDEPIAASQSTAKSINASSRTNPGGGSSKQLNPAKQIAGVKDGAM